MPNVTYKELPVVLDFIAEVPAATGAATHMDYYGTVQGMPQGSDFVMPPSIVGKTLTKVDSVATTTGAVSYKFKSTDFVNPEKPLLSEIVAALNTAWDEAADTDAESGALGELVIKSVGTGGAAATFELYGDACDVLGFGGDGVHLKTDEGAGTVTVTFPSTWGGKYRTQFWQSRFPKIHLHLFDPATGDRTKIVEANSPTWVLDASAKTITFTTAGADALSYVAFHIEL